MEKVSWYTMPQGYLWSRAGTKPGDREAAMLQAGAGWGAADMSQSTAGSVD